MVLVVATIFNESELVERRHAVAKGRFGNVAIDRRGNFLLCHGWRVDQEVKDLNGLASSVHFQHGCIVFVVKLLVRRRALDFSQSSSDVMSFPGELEELTIQSFGESVLLEIDTRITHRRILGWHAGLVGDHFLHGTFLVHGVETGESLNEFDRGRGDLHAVCHGECL